uniref:Signal recognition particle 19 kDa protein n=1 Tax=Heterorhabditis bacteriophora TaxID=37862 RepID=A0A1I7WG50_HETBA
MQFSNWPISPVLGKNMSRRRGVSTRMAWSKLDAASFSHAMQTRLPPCKRGCEVLTDNQMENATYYGGKPKVYYNGNKEYWPQGVEVKTRCKEVLAHAYPKREAKNK